MATLQFDMTGLLNGLTEFSTKADMAMWMYTDTAALKVQNYAKRNRPWTDRTGDARKRLTGTPEATKTGYRIKLAHGVDYGIWLELAHEKRFAIIEPTIKAMGPEVIKGFEKLLEKL